MRLSHRWAVLGVGTGAQTGFSAVIVGVPVLAPNLRAHYGLSLSAVGVVLASLNVGQMLTLLPWGLLTDRLGERLVTGVGLGIAASALAGAAFAPGITSLIALLFVAGAFGTSVNAATGRAVMGWFGPRQRGVALGLRQTAIPIGGTFAALTLPAIGGLRWPFVTLAGACLVAGTAGAIWLREGPEAGDEALDVEALVHPLRDRRIWLLSSASALLVSAQMSILGFTVLFLHGTRGFSTGEAGAVLAGIQGIGAFLRVASGRWSDRLGRRLLPMRALALALAAALAVNAALLGASTVALVPALLVAGGLAMSWNGLAFTATAEFAGRARSGAALGFQQTALAIAGAVTPLVFAPVVEATSWRTGFALVVLSPLAALVVLHPLGRR